jgi:hypothetical protein
MQAIVKPKCRVIYKFFRDFRLLRYSSRDVHAEGENVNRGRDTPSFCTTLELLDISTFCGSMSTEGETLQVSVLPYRCLIFPLLWEHVNRGRDTPSFCPTLQLLDISTFCGRMSTEGETLQVSVLPYRCLIFPPFVETCH